MTAIDKRGAVIEVGDTITLTGKVINIFSDRTVSIAIDNKVIVTAPSNLCERLGKLQQEAKESLERAQKGAEQGASGLLKSEY